MKKILLIAIALLVTLYTNAITVTITVDEGFDNFAIIEKMQTNRPRYCFLIGFLI